MSLGIHAIPGDDQTPEDVTTWVEQRLQRGMDCVIMAARRQREDGIEFLLVESDVVCAGATILHVRGCGTFSADGMPRATSTCSTRLFIPRPELIAWATGEFLWREGLGVLYRRADRAGALNLAAKLYKQDRMVTQ